MIAYTAGERSPLEFRDPARGRALLEAIARWTEDRIDDPVSIMHVCGSHEQAIARFGLRSVLPKGLRIITDTSDGAAVDPAELAKAQRRSPLAWALVSNDILESLGGIERHEAPADDLAARIADLVPYPREQIDENIRSWADQGLLKYDVKDGRLVWRWA